jgi:YVTN family beta-propeller protein
MPYTLSRRAAFGPIAALAAVLPSAFVLNSLDGDVSVIDSITWTEIKRIPTGKRAAPPVPDAGREIRVIVANALAAIRSPSSTRARPRCSARCAASATRTTCAFRPT